MAGHRLRTVHRCRFFAPGIEAIVGPASRVELSLAAGFSENVVEYAIAIILIMALLWVFTPLLHGKLLHRNTNGPVWPSPQAVSRSARGYAS